MGFVDYCLSFYGDVPGSLGYFQDWGYNPMTRTEIEKVIPLVAAMYPDEKCGNSLTGDSFTRELVRDFVIHGRGIDTDVEHFTSSEGRDIFRKNRDRWQSELHERLKGESVSHSVLMSYWHEIIKDCKVKPSWFGFLTTAEVL